MPIVSVIILTKNREAQLPAALTSVKSQTLGDIEIVVVNDGSTDTTAAILATLQDTFSAVKIITHQASVGITQSRQEALQACTGKYVALLDDDDIWVDTHKLQKQVRYLDEHPDAVLLGGGMEVASAEESVTPGQMRQIFRPESDQIIRRTMLFRNNFLTSTVMFRREAALAAGGFIADAADLAEDYDLWLRLGLRGHMYNFPEVFVRYRQSLYTKDKFKAFLRKQLRLIQAHQGKYPHYWLARMLLVARLYLRF